jgi:hypothetical protein
MKIREYPLRVGVTKIYAPITKILSVKEKNNQILMWAETEKRDKNSIFIFLTVENDWDLSKIPYFSFAKYLTTVLIQGKPRHIYFYHKPGEVYLDRDEEKVLEAFNNAIIQGIPEPSHKKKTNNK